MYTYDSCTQVYAFLLLTSDFERITVDLIRLKFVGYDRACDLHQFLKNLSTKENVGAKISYWVGQVWYFSSAKAQRTVLYITREQQSAAIIKDTRGTNTESAEQRNHFSNRFKERVMEWLNSIVK